MGGKLFEWHKYLLIGIIRHVYGNGGIRKVRALALCMHKGRLEEIVNMVLITIITVLDTQKSHAFGARLIFWMLAWYC